MARKSAEVQQAERTLQAVDAAACALEEAARAGTPEEGCKADERFSAALAAHDKALSQLPRADREKYRAF
jgi:hypothetical protein